MSDGEIVILGSGWFPDESGGLNRYVRDLLAALRRAGLPARGVVLGPAGDAPEEVAVAGRADDSLPLRLWRYARAARHAGAGARVVDAHFALYALGSALVGPLRATPLVFHFHGPWAEESRATGEGSAGRLFLKRVIERRVAARAAETIVLSRAFRRLAVEHCGVPPWSVSVIPPGVDLQRFGPGDVAAARRGLDLADDAWVAVSVRRLVSRTGLAVLLDAWSRLPSDGAVLLVVGAGPERAALEAKSAELGLGGAVRFLGRTTEETLLSCYRAADVCIVPSVELEGFGLVVLEALACGTPVVATDAGGLPEAVASLDPSLVVPAGDAELLASRLAAARQGRLPLPSRDRCRRHAEGFSWEAAVGQHEEIYDRVARPKVERRSLRVVYLDHCARLSGAELALLRLLPALTNVDAHVILAEEGPLVERLVESEISVEVLAMSEAARGLERGRVGLARTPVGSLAGSSAYVARLARRLARLRPDLVHTNSLKAALYGGVAARVCGIPSIWHLRDRVAADYLPGGAITLVRAAAERLPVAIIANSRATLATLADASVRLPPRVTVIHDPIHVHRNASTRGGGELCLGMVGRIAPWKGQDVFLEAFARAFPGGSERARIVGSPLFGEEGYERDVRELAATLGIADRVEFTGFKEDVDGELAQIDVLVHASRIPEPFGQVVVEGMAFGLPVVAAGAGGPGEVIEDGVDGVLYRPGDAQALAEVLRRLSEDGELRVRLGAAARRQATRFAPALIAGEVTEVYRSALGRDV